MPCAVCRAATPIELTRQAHDPFSSTPCPALWCERLQSLPSSSASHPPRASEVWVVCGMHDTLKGTQIAWPGRHSPPAHPQPPSGIRGWPPARSLAHPPSPRHNYVYHQRIEPSSGRTCGCREAKPQAHAFPGPHLHSIGGGSAPQTECPERARRTSTAACRATPSR